MAGCGSMKKTNREPQIRDLLSASGLRPLLESARTRPVLLSWSDVSYGLERIDTKIPGLSDYIRKCYCRQMLFLIIGFDLILILPWIDTAYMW